MPSPKPATKVHRCEFKTAKHLGVAFDDFSFDIFREHYIHKHSVPLAKAHRSTL
jgi:hypothetical protein